MERKNWIKWIVGIIIILIIVGFVTFKKPTTNNVIKIGIITDLTGPAAYWGESTKIGTDILKKELEAKGEKVEFIFEDYALDATKAITAVQKLYTIDKVNAVYTEFNPGSIAVASFLKDKQIPLIYDAAIVSPLKDNILFYKTYLDYKEGCKQIAQKFNEEGVTKIGLLKVNLEFGELCESGIREIYKDNLISEGYNLGDNDFRTQLLKIKNNNATAVINVGFEGDTFNTLKVIKDLKYNIRYGSVDDTITEKVLSAYKDELKNGWTFGFNDISEEFMGKLENNKPSSLYAAALSYTHIKQLVESLDRCGDKNECIIKSLDNSRGDPTIGFIKYKDHIADLKMSLKKY
jgi:ABC-type branched-subunit amino acid transport system substrate-binding protein